MKHKIGLIGYGSIASGYHNDTFNRDDVDFELAAVYDIRESQRKLAEERGIKTFDNLRDFLDSGLFEMVTVAIPNNNHCPIACAALEAGYHVMVEKPAALNSGEIMTMMDTAKKCGKIFTVHHNRRFDRDFLIVRQAIEEGLLGKLHTIETRIHPRLKEGGGLGGWRSFADHGGGFFLDWGIHTLDQLLYLIKEPVDSVYCNMVKHDTNECDDYMRVIVTFRSGLSAIVETAMRSTLWLPRWYVSGNEGTLSMDFIGDTTAKIRRVAEKHYMDGTTLAYNLNEAYERPILNNRVVDKYEEFDYPTADKCPPQDWASLYKNLSAVLEGREELVVKPEEVLRCFRVVEAAFRSAKEHKSVQL